MTISYEPEATRSQALLVGQNRLLELMATGRELSEVLDFITRFIEEQSQDSYCSVLLLDQFGTRLRCVAAPSLPEGYQQAMDNLVINPNVGSCGAAVYRKEAVIVSDIAAEPSWEPFKELALSHQLRACWSQPILGMTGKVLGTFAIYYTTPRSPNKEEWEVVKVATYLAAIAIERQQTEEILKRYQLLSDNARDIVLFIRIDGQILEANYAALQAYGYQREELLRLKIQDLRAFPTQNLINDQMAKADTEGLLFETLHRRKDGSTFPVEVSSQGTRIDGERVLLSIIRDITERKLAEEQQRVKVCQQAALSQLSQQALVDADINRLIEAAVRLITRTLELEYAAVLELLPAKDAFMVKAGVGWQSDVVGKVMVETGTNSLAGYTLLSHQPVRVENWQAETRLSKHALLQQQGIQSSISVLIGDAKNTENVSLKAPFGVLSAHSTGTRRFNENDIAFLQAIANLLATAIERHQTETALRTSEERLRLSLEAGCMGIWDWHIPTGKLSWSDNLETLHGFTPGTFDGTFAGFMQVVHPEDQAFVTQAIHRALEERSDYDIELRIVHPCDGSIHWMTGKGKVFCDETGTPLRMIGLGMDITERKQTEQELQKSKEQLEIILRGVADGITVQTNTGLIYANDAAARLVGYSSVEAFLAAPVTEVMQKFEVMDEWGQPFGLEQLPGRFAMQGKETQEILLRYRIKATGEERWSLVKSAPVLDDRGNVQFAINIFHDITERKRAEEAQRFLAEASTILASSLDYQTTLENMARLVIPRLADWCAIDMLGENNSIQRLSVVHVDPSKIQWARQLETRYPPNPNAATGVANVLRTGKSELYPEIEDSQLVASAEDAEHLEILRNFGFSSAMIVPLMARGHTLGAITFICAESGRRLSQADLAFAEEMAHRAALAVDNARLYREAQEKHEESRRYAIRLQGLAEASAAFTAAKLELQAVLDTVVEKTTALLGDTCVIRLLSDDGEWLNPVAIHHSKAEEVPFLRELVISTPHRAHEGLSGRVMQTGTSLLFPIFSVEQIRAVTKPEYIAFIEHFGVNSLMVAPLRVQGRAIGVIFITRDRTSQPYTEDDRLLLQDLADRAALAISNARLFEAAQKEIQERQNAEEALFKRASELAHLTNILAQTNSVLEKRNKELDQFAYIVSHDLKAPLRAISNLSEWIEEDLQGQITEDIQHHINLMRGRVYRMEGLINGLLQYSRIGRMKTESEPVDVQSLLTEVIDSLAPSAAFTVTVETPMPTFLTERLPLEQVFANLIGNSIKHHDKTKGKVTISCQDKGDTYEFAVSDDGPGMAPEYHDQVFRIFETLKPRDQLESTGIGLAIVKKIIEDKGGAIRLESQVGLGSTFYFTWAKSTTAIE